MRKAIPVTIIITLLLAMLAGSVAADHSSDAPTDGDMPASLQKIKEYNLQSAKDTAVKVSFVIAFLAGLLGILSPCILPFIPAYFSVTFKEKKNITKMTGVFFLGFTLVFVTMGIVAGFIGERSLAILQTDTIVTIAALLILAMGVMTLMGKGFNSFFHFKRKLKNDIPGVFLMGIAFALGWSACLGPILVGVLGIGALLHNTVLAGFLMFFYSLGNLAPLFILSLLWDKFNLSESRFVKGKTFHFTLDDKKYPIHSTNLIGGLLFILLGVVILVFKGTAVVNTWDIFRTKEYFYSLQNALVGWQYANVVGVIALAAFVIIIGGHLWKKNNKKRSER